MEKELRCKICGADISAYRSLDAYDDRCDDYIEKEDSNSFWESSQRNKQNTKKESRQ